jgi:hypothetical protein
MICDYLVTFFKLIVKMHCMIWYTDTYSIIVMSLLYRLNDMVKYVYYMGPGSNSCFVTGVALMGGHYRTDIINGIGYPRSDSVLPLVLCTVAYNIQGTGVVLQVPRDNVNLTENG